MHLLILLLLCSLPVLILLLLRSLPVLLLRLLLPVLILPVLLLPVLILLPLISLVLQYLQIRRQNRNYMHVLANHDHAYDAVPVLVYHVRDLPVPHLTQLSS